MKRFVVTGMSCSACSARVEHAVSKVQGVDSCSVNLLTNILLVDGEAAPETIIKAVEKEGYQIEYTSGTASANESVSEQPASLPDFEKTHLINRLVSSGILLVVLMYFSMGISMFGLPVMNSLKDNVLAIGFIQMILTTIILLIHQSFFVKGFSALLHRTPNMDTLVALGATASYVWSVIVIFLMTDAAMNQDIKLLHRYYHELYFESAAMILTLITLGKLLEAHSKGKTTNALNALMQLAPDQAVVLKDGQEVKISAKEVQIDDIFLVRPGEQIPVDGIVLEGNSAVDESSLTGESIHADKKEGEQVYASTMNYSGFIKCKATRVGEDTVLSQIIQIVSDASAGKAPIAKIADRVSGIFVPVVMLIALVTFCIWLVLGRELSFALARAVSVLVISCPCALGLATPVAIMVGNGVAAKQGILFKTAVALEQAGKVNTVVLDKTGTITKGKPEVVDVVLTGEMSETSFLSLAAGLEQFSEHPLAKAVVNETTGRQIPLQNMEQFQNLPGNGVMGMLGNDRIVGGNLECLSTYAGIKKEEIEQKIFLAAKESALQGKTPIYFAKNQHVLGMIAIADAIKDDSPQAILELQNMGLEVLMLTGDQEDTAKYIGDLVGVNRVIAGVMPQQKGQIIQQLQESGRVAMVGDGINDAVALTNADVGIAIGTGTDVAVESADVVLTNSNLSDVVALIRLSRGTLRIIHQNLFWAFFYNIIGIPLAAGVWIPIFGWTLSPMFGAAAMGLSSFCVVSNALRLNRIKLDSPARGHRKGKTVAHEKAKIVKSKESKMMKKTMKIEGMMCGHCEARVKKVLEELPQVAKAEVDHESGTAIVTLETEIDDSVLKKVVTDQDYTVTDIQ